MLHTLPKIITTKKKRLGLGHGSGRSKTAGRGTKGDKARGTSAMYRYSGGSLAFVKRLPMLRGKLRNNGWKPKAVVVALEKLKVLPGGTIVDIKTLVAHRLISQRDAKQSRVKILGNKGVTVPLTVQIPVSKSAAEVIVKAGGVVQITNE